MGYAMAAESLVGTWRLISYHTRALDAGIRYPFGQHARGYLIYSPEGFMSVAIMREDRQAVTTPWDETANPFQVRSWLPVRRLIRLLRYILAATRYISYSGRYTVAGATVIHHVEVSQMPGLLQTNQERSFELRDNCLVLTAENAAIRQQLVWERVPSVATEDASAPLRYGLHALPTALMSGAEGRVDRQLGL